MNLLITTSHSLLELNVENSNIRNIHSGSGLYYGITSSDEKIFVAARNRMVSSAVPVEEECGEIMVFDRCLNLIGCIDSPFPLRDMHEISWHDGSLWVTCSYDNFIAIWDGNAWERWFPLQEDRTDCHDVHHYNSFLFEEGRLWLLAHNQGASELLAFSFHNKSLIGRIKIGSHAHNVWREGSQLFILSSGDGKVIGNEGFVLETGGFPRGYLHYGDRRYVGINEPAERSARDSTTSSVIIFNENWKYLKKIQLPDEGMILDIVKI